ncbi:substrate-binding domain-containing protein [Polaromonas sp.]|uniref:substrate-binding domain-containing protein n=1 Tax=Polaromonas sp. TaxID=1869339 RepID=UPI00286A75B3|nr:substrate-binding domain-containing protein [Polaromonas sp.]
MATRLVLAELTAAWEQSSGCAVNLESVGGVDAVRRAQAGEPFDIVVLASDAIDKLTAGGFLVAGSKVDLADSGVAVCVCTGAPWPDISSEDALRRAVLAARSIGYSTGPSGAALIELFERWGMAADVRQKAVQAPAGVPVGGLVARGEAELGFQQLSELMHLDGIAVVGPLPEAVQIITTFSAGLGSASTQGEVGRRLLAFMASPETADAKRRHGMAPA